MTTPLRNARRAAFTAALSAAAIAATSAPADAASPESFVANPGFETGQLQPWSEWHPDGQRSAVGVDHADPHSGSAKAYFWSEEPFRQSIHQVVDTDQYADDRVWEVSAWVKLRSYTGTPPRTARMEVGDVHVDFAVGDAWQRVSTLVDRTGRVDIGFYLDAAGYTSLQIDDVKAEPLLRNATFDRRELGGDGWTEWHPEGREAAVSWGCDPNSDDCYLALGPPAGVNWTSEQLRTLQQSVHQKVTGLPEGDYRVEAVVQAPIASWTPWPRTRMELADHGGPRVDVPIATRSVFGDYASKTHLSTTVHVATGSLDLGFFIEGNDSTTYSAVRLHDVTLTRVG